MQVLARRAAHPDPLIAAPPLRPGLLDGRRLFAVISGSLLAVLAGGVPYELAAPILAALVLLVGMLLAPIVGLYALMFAIPFSPTFGLEDTAFSISIFEPLALLTILFWLVRGFVRHEIMLPREGLLGALVLLLTLLVIAGGGATSYPLAIKEILKWVLLILAYVFTRVTVRDERGVRIVLVMLFLAGAAQAIMGMVQFALGIGPPAFAIGTFMRAYGMFGQPNPFAGYLGTVVPLAIAMSIAPGSRPFRAVAMFAVAMTVIGILLSFSRGAWLGLALSIGVMLVAWSRRARMMAVPLAMAFVVMVVLAILGVLPPTIANRITSVTDNFGVFDVRTVTLSSENFAVVERMAHWQAGWAIFLDHPFLGVGPGNYPAVYDQYYIPPWVLPLGHAHNYYLNMAAEAGLPGLLALLVVLALAVRALLRRLRAATPAPGTHSLIADTVFDPPMSPTFARFLAIGLLGSLTMFSIHNLFDNLLVHGVGIQIGVLLGLIGGVSNR